MKKIALFMCFVLMASLIGGCSDKKPSNESAAAIEVTTTTSETIKETVAPTPTPTPTPEPADIYVNEAYFHKNNGDTVLTELKKFQDDKLIYEASFFRSGNGIQLERSYEYDDEGSLTEIIETSVYRSDDYHTVRRYLDHEYDDAGNLILITESDYIVDDETSEEIFSSSFKNEYSYDKDGDLLSEERSDADTGRLISSRENTYDEEGRLISSRIIDEDNSSDTIEYYSYDTEGKLISLRTETTDVNGTSVTSRNYSYDGELLTGETLYQGDSTLIYSSFYGYDDEGHMTYSETRSFDHAHGGSESTICYFEYDEEGRIVKSWDHDDPESYTEYVYYVEEA